MKIYQKRLFFVSLAALFVVSGFFVVGNVLATISSGTGTDWVQTAQNDSAGGNLTISKPSLTASGDVLVASIVYEKGDDATVTAPSGWTLIRQTDNGNHVGLRTYYKVAGSSEPASYLWNIKKTSDNDPKRGVGGIIRYTGVDTSNPIDIYSENTGNSDTPSASSVTTTQANDLVIAVFGVKSNESFDTPSLTTERYDLTNSHNDGPATAVSDFTQAVAGATGAKTSDNSGSGNDKWVAQMIALKAITTITVNKVCVPSNDAGKFNLQIDGTTVGTGANALCGGATGAVSVTAASHTVSETAGTGTSLTDYTSVISGDCNAAGVITPQILAGQSKVCTITNTKKGHLIVQKTTIPAEDGTEFSITATGDGTITGGGGGTITDATDKNYEVTPGTYSVLETVPAGWSKTSDTCQNVVVTAGETVNCLLINTKLGEIHGMKFEDINGNGVKDNGENGLENWTIELTGQNHEKRTTTTNEGGLYSFFDVFSDVYTVNEVSQQGWTQTTTNPDPINIQPGSVFNDINFGNFHEVTITIFKWDDTNGNGQKDDGEPGLKDVPVEVRRVLDGHFPVQDPLIDTELVQLSLTGVDGSLNLHVPTPGNHIVMEQPQDGWQKTYPVESFFDIFVEVSGQTINMGTPHGCTPVPLVTNCDPVPLTFGNFKLITITVQKDVVNPQEGTATDNHTFKVKLNNGTQDNFSENSSKIYTNVGPGNHNLAEIGDPDFDLLRIVAGDQIINGTDSITLVSQSGHDITVIITNKQKPGHLTVKKIVQNHGIKDSASPDFMMGVEGTNVSNSSFAGSEEGTTVTLNPGSYSVGESGPDGYAMSLSEGCSGTIDSNENVTCTITNSDIPVGKGAITVIKSVINDNGGEGEANDFTLTITPEEDDSSEVSNGQAQFLDPGNYTVGENPNPFHYEQKSISCTNGETTTDDGSVTLTEQEAWVCTITNNDQAPSLTLVKQVTNNNGGTATANDWTLTATGSSVLSGAGAAVSASDFQAGTYTLSETATNSELDINEGYTAGTWSCVKNGSGPVTGSTISLSIGDTATCTIINDDQPATLIIKKKTNGEGDGTFNFQVTGGQSTQQRSIETEGGNGTASTVTLDAGTYQVNEINLPSIWHLANVDCQYENNSVGTSIAGGEEITVHPGDEVTCTFTNTKKGTLIVKKIVINDNGGTKTAPNFSFSVNGSESATAFEEDGQNNIVVDPGTYSITETADTGYTTTYENCSGLEITAGSEQTCIITNNDIAPVIVPAKLTVIKEVINNSGKTKTASQFTLFVSETQVTTGVQNSFVPGTYNVHETADSAYSILLIDGDCNAQGNITLAAGDVKTCRIVNDDIAPESTGGGSGPGAGGSTSITADPNNDGKIDTLDLAVVFANWGNNPTNPAADLNKDGKVDIVDFTILMVNWTT